LITITIWTLVINYFWITFDQVLIISFFNFGRLLTLKRVKQGTSNLVHKLTMASFNQRMIKYPQMECGLGYVTFFLTFWDSPMVPGTSNLVFRLTTTSTIKRMVNYPVNRTWLFMYFETALGLNLFTLKLKTSSFVICTQVDNTIQQLINYPKRGVFRVFKGA